LKIPVLATYQFNRESAKKKKGEQITQDDVYGSDAIAQLSTIMLGLLENTTIEQEKSRTVMILKGRGGETGAFKVNWDFQKMNFDEIVKLDPDQGPPESEEMMFLD
jgi:replicative DNA helicase